MMSLPLMMGATIVSLCLVMKHVEGVSYVDQDKDPEYNGRYITDDDFSGRSVHTTTCLEPGVAEVLSTEMSHGMSQIGVPHFTHAVRNAVCDGVDAELTKFLIVVMYMVVAAKEQHIMPKTGGITLKMRHCLCVCLIPWGIQKS